MGAWPLLTTADLDLTLNRWDLTQTLSDTLGDLGTPADGFDSYLNETITLLSGLENLGGALLEDLNLAAGIAGTIDPTSLNSDAASLPASLAAGDAIVADANALLGSVGPPPPAGGGGGGGGTGGGASTPCVDVNFGTVTGYSQPLQRTLTLVNHSGTPITVKSVTPAAQQGNIAALVPDPTGIVLAPGASLQLTVGIYAVPGTYSFSWTLNTDAPDPQPCITVELVARDPVGDGGTGPPSCILPIYGCGGPPGGRG